MKTQCMRKIETSLWLLVELREHKLHQNLCFDVDCNLSQRVLFYFLKYFQKKYQAYCERSTKVPITQLAFRDEFPNIISLKLI